MLFYLLYNYMYIYLFKFCLTSCFFRVIYSPTTLTNFFFSTFWKENFESFYLLTFYILEKQFKSMTRVTEPTQFNPNVSYWVGLDSLFNKSYLVEETYNLNHLAGSKKYFIQSNPQTHHLLFRCP